MTTSELLANTAAERATRRYTTADLDLLPQPWDDTRYEIIDGELKVSRQPFLGHQDVCTEVAATLRVWSRETGKGRALFAPGVIFQDDQNVAPDVIWISNERLRAAMSAAGADGHLYAAPDLIVEVLSAGTENERPDLDAKLRLYSRRGVQEYWVIDWHQQYVRVYRREQPDHGTSAENMSEHEGRPLTLVATLGRQDTLTSPLLPGFRVRVGDLFFF
jgi:Uma2 family endonuclease